MLTIAVTSRQLSIQTETQPLVQGFSPLLKHYAGFSSLALGSLVFIYVCVSIVKIGHFLIGVKTLLR